MHQTAESIAMSHHRHWAYTHNLCSFAHPIESSTIARGKLLLIAWHLIAWHPSKGGFQRSVPYTHDAPNFLYRLYCGFQDAIEVFDVNYPGEGERIFTTPSKKSRSGLKGEAF